MTTVTTTSIRRAIYGKLAGDTTLNGLLGDPAPGYSKAIYYQIAPSGSEFPYVVFNKQAGTPMYVFRNGKPGYENEVWLVKAIDESRSADVAESVSARIDVLLGDASLTISGGSLMSLRRDSDVDYSELDSGVIYKHAGALYRVLAQPTD